MCGRLAMTDIPWNELARLWMSDAELADTQHADGWRSQIAETLEELHAVQPRFNVAPTQEVLTISSGWARGYDSDPRDNYHLSPMRWGLIPAGSRDRRVGARMINARSETLSELQSFSPLLGTQRCLVLASGFFEWERVGKRKLPFFIKPREGSIFAFAGLWDEWAADDGEVITSCTIITTPANAPVSQLHARMPAILSPDLWHYWLDVDLPVSDVQAMLTTADDDVVAMHRVSSVVNSIQNDDPECVVELQLDLVEQMVEDERRAMEDHSEQIGLF